MEAARHCLGMADARGALDEDTRLQLQRQSEQLGIDLARLMPARGASKIDEAFEVLAENFDAVRVFEASQSQWRMVAGMAGLVYLGFDYPGVHVVAKALGLGKKWPDVLMRLQVMEMEGARLLNGRT